MFAFVIGITISGLHVPLTVGQSATIKCMTNIPVTSIEWRDQSSDVLTNTADQAVLEYTIPLVTDDLQGQNVTCVAIVGATIVGATIYTVSERVKIHVAGKD